jgi:hypothetical protein
VGQAAAAAEAKAAGLRRDAPGFRRVIELRGRNLSAEARFTIAAGETEYELPFRMLEEIQDSRGNRLRVPRIVVPEDQTGTPNMARRLRLTIPRDELDAVDRKSYDAWFGHAGQQQLKFTILNPDGQQAAVDFSMPPAVAWK